MKPLNLIEFSFSMSLEHRKGKFGMSVLESEFQKRKQSPLMASCVVMFKNVGSRSKRRDSISSQVSVLIQLHSLICILQEREPDNSHCRG